MRFEYSVPNLLSSWTSNNQNFCSALLLSLGLAPLTEVGLQYVESVTHS